MLNIRKYIVLIIVILLLCGMLAACGDNKKESSINKNTTKGNADEEYIITVTAPDGWSVFKDDYTKLRYRKDSGQGDFFIKQGLSGASLDSDISNYKERENSGGYKIEWEDVKDTKIGNMDAKYLKYTVDAGGTKIWYNAYFIQKNKNLFTIICMTSLDEKELENDYKVFLDSLKISTK